jgi:hypothetical protein
MATLVRWRCLTCEADGFGGLLDCDADARRHSVDRKHQAVLTAAYTPGDDSGG